MNPPMHARLDTVNGEPTVFIHTKAGLICGMIRGETVSVGQVEVDGKTLYYTVTKTGGKITGKLGPHTLRILVNGDWKVNDLVPYWEKDDLTADDLREMARKAKEAKKVKQGEDITLSKTNLKELHNYISTCTGNN